MAYNTKSIVKDVNQKPAPQLFNPDLDAYEVILGKNGASRVMVYDIAGNAIDLVALVASIITAINTTGSTQLRAGDNNIGKVDINASTLPTGASTSAKQDELKASIESMDNKDATSTSYGSSLETKPAGTIKGDKFFEYDTGEVYMWTGAAWVVV